MDILYNAFGMLVTINKLNDKRDVLHSWYNDMYNTVEITEISGRWLARKDMRLSIACSHI